MRVLLLSQYFWPESFRINEVARSMRDAGCEVTVLTGQPNYPEGRVFAGYRAWSTRREQYHGCEVVRVPLAPRGRGGGLRLALNYLSFVIWAGTIGAWLLRGRRFDVIFVYGISPVTQAIPGMVLRRSTGAALVLWVQDIWPQSLEITGFVRNRRLLDWAGRMVRWIYRRCDLLLVQSEGFIPLVRELAGSTPVECHPNPGEASLQNGAAELPALRLEAGFNVVFAGNFGTLQALDTILAAAELLADEPRIRIVLIGSGSRGEWVRGEVERRRLDNVTMPGRFQQEQMAGILSQASVLLVTLARSPILAQTIPSKLQAYLAVGRPILASLDGEGARIVNEAGAGVAVPAEDATALADALRRLQAMPSAELNRMGDSGRRYYDAHFEPTTLARRLRKRFEELAHAREIRKPR